MAHRNSAGWNSQWHQQRQQPEQQGAKVGQPQQQQRWQTGQGQADSWHKAQGSFQQAQWQKQPQQQQQSQPSWQKQPQQQQQQASWQKQLPQQQQQQQGSATVAAGIIKKPPIQTSFPETYIVSSTGPDAGEVVIRTLMGEYVESGNNHHRKVYKKAAGTVPGSVEVFLYYWDNSEGPDFEGWWFGNQLGGSQVWSHCKSSSMQPPASGWKIPWDGDVRPTLLVRTKTLMQKNSIEERVQSISGELAVAEATAQTALEQARGLAGDCSYSEGLHQAEQLLQPQVAALNDANKQLQEAKKAAGPDATAEFSQLASKLRGVISTVNNELQKFRTMRSKAQQQEKVSMLEEKDMVIFQGFMPEAVQKTDLAEDCVEKAVITAEMIISAGDDLDDVRMAVDQTEEAAKEATTLINDARVYVNTQLAASRRLESDRMRNQAVDEIGKLQVRLQAAQGKLNPIKSVRLEYQQRQTAKKLVSELLEKLAPSELDVDKAQEAAEVLNLSDSPTKELLQKAEQALKKANDSIASSARLVETKKKTATGVVRDEVDKIEDRIKLSQERLNQLKESQKASHERVACEGLAKEASDKLQAVADAVTKAADAEGPFLMGLEELPIEETLAAVKACETASTSANTTCSIARMFIATKLVEVKRFSGGAGEEVHRKLKDYQKQLEDHTKKLNDLKATTVTRKKSTLAREAEGQVAKAERLAHNVAESAAVFVDDATLFGMSIEAIRDAAQEIQKADVAANVALADARKFITGRQIESKGKDASAEVTAELIKYQTRLSTAQAEVAKFKKVASTVEERLAAKKNIDDYTAKIVAAEGKVAKAVELATELGEMAAESDGEKAIEEAVKAAEASSKGAQAALKLASRSLEANTRAQGMAKEEIEKLKARATTAQERLDKAMVAMREQSENFVVSGLLTEAELKIKEAEGNVMKCSEAEEPFLKGVEDLPVEEEIEALADLEGAIAKAHTSVNNAKTFIAMKRLVAKRVAEAAAKKVNLELEKLQTRCDAAAKKLAETKKSMGDRTQHTIKREHEFVAGRLLKDATEQVEQLENKFEATNVAAEPLISEEKKEDFASATFLSHIVDALRKFSKDKEITTAGLFKQISEGEAMTDVKFISFLQNLPELEKQLEFTLSEEQIKGAFRRMCTENGGVVNETTFLSQFTRRYTCSAVVSMTDSLAVKGGKTLRKLEVSELVEGVEEPTSDGAVGLTRVKVRAEKDGKEGYVTLTGNQGTRYLQEFTQYAACHKKVEQALKEMEDQLSKTTKYMRHKDDELQAVTTGPLADMKLDLAKLQPRISTVASKVAEVRKKVTACHKQHSQCMEIEKRKGQEAAEKKAATEIVEECNGLMSVLQAEADEAGSTAEELAKLKGASKENPYVALQDAARALEVVLESSQKAQAKLKEHMENAKSAKGPLADARVTATKLRVKMSSMDAKCKKQIAALQAARKDLADVAHAAIANALRAYVQNMSTSPDDLFKKLSPDGQNIPADDLRSFIEKVSDANLKPPDLELGLGRYESGMTKLTLFEMLQAYHRCVKSIAVSCAFAVKDSKTIRKLDVGELVEVIETGKVDEDAGVERIRCRAIADHLEGWTTLKGNQGTAFLEKAAKPYFCCEEERALHVGFESGSAEARKVAPGEVLELLEGPRQEPPVDTARVKGKASKDGKTGYVSLKDGAGNVNLELAKLYTCKATIAITDAFDITDGKAIRKLEVGEIMEFLGEPVTDDARSLVRVRAKTVSDGKEGYVTIKGNQGTSYAEESDKHYICKRSVSLDSKFSTGSSSLRMLEEGEFFEGLEAPKVETKEMPNRIRGRSLIDGTEGWISQTKKSLSVWSPHYKCVEGSPLHDALEILSGKVLRKLELGEALEALGSPMPEKAGGVLRVRARAVKDGTTGYATVKDGKGKALLEVVLR